MPLSQLPLIIALVTVSVTASVFVPPVLSVAVVISWTLVDLPAFVDLDNFLLRTARGSDANVPWNTEAKMIRVGIIAETVFMVYRFVGVTGGYDFNCRKIAADKLLWYLGKEMICILLEMEKEDFCCGQREAVSDTI